MRRVKIKTIVIPARARSKNYFGSATYSSNVGSSAGSSAPAVINYLPAYQNEDGTYTVDLEKVFFNGHVIAEKDVVCFGKEAGSESTTVIVDAAFSETSENTLQNKVITLKFKEVDQNIGNLSTLTTKDKSSLVAAINEAFQNAGMNVKVLWDTLAKNTKEQINKSHLTAALNGYATQTWVTEKAYATQTWVTQKGYITSAALNGYATQTWVTQKGYLTSHQSISHLANKDGTNASGTWSINITGSAGSAGKASAVKDYNSTDGLVYLGYAGSSLTTTEVDYFAAYDGNKIKDLSKANAASIIKDNATGTWGISITGDADTVDNVHLEWSGSQTAAASAWLAAWTSDGKKIKCVSQSSLSVDNAAKLGNKPAAEYVTTNTSQTIDANKTFTEGISGDGFWDISTYGEAWFDGNVLSNGEITCYSDRRLKTDIQPLKNRGFIQPVTYSKDGKKCIGFIAQDVREKYPELVMEGETKEKFLSLNYAQYTAVLQSQIIELRNEIDQLKKELKEVKR